MQKKEFRKLISRTRRAARAIERKVDKLRTRLRPKGLQLMGCLDLPTIKEAILQSNYFHASADCKIRYVLIQNVEFRQLGNVLIIQPTSGSSERERKPPFASPLKEADVETNRMYGNMLRRLAK